jgi:hypothetical protein
MKTNIFNFCYRISIN